MRPREPLAQLSVFWLKEEGRKKSSQGKQNKTGPSPLSSRSGSATDIDLGRPKSGAPRPGCSKPDQ